MIATYLCHRFTARCRVFSRVPTASSFQRPFHGDIRPARVRLTQLSFYPLWAPSSSFPFLLVPCYFLFFPICVCFQVLRRRSSPCLFAAHGPRQGLFPRPHRDELLMSLLFSILSLCTIGVCFFRFYLFISLYCFLHLVVFVVFVCFFFVLFYFLVLLACNKTISSLTRIMSPSGF